MVNFNYAVITVPTRKDYDKLESFVCDLFQKKHMFSVNIWDRRAEDTCVRIVSGDGYVDFGYSHRSYYEHDTGRSYVRKAPLELQLCSVDEFIAYVEGESHTSIDNETLVSLL